MQFKVAAATIKADAARGLLTATLSNDVPGAPPFNLAIAFYESGIARVRITENDGNAPRWEVRRFALRARVTDGSP